MKKDLLLLMIFSLLMGCVFAKTSETSKPKNSYIVWTCNRAEFDSTNHAINMDTIQIAYFNRFLNDSVRYYERDSALRLEIESLRSELSAFKTKVEQGGYNSTKLWVRILLFSMAFLLIAILLYLVLRFRGLRDEIVDVVKGSGRIKEWLNDYKNDKPSTKIAPKSYDGDIRSLQNENRELKNRLVALEDMLKERNDSSDRERPMASEQQPSSGSVETQKLLYADSIIDGEFSHVKEQENDDTVFVLTLKSESAATVSIFRPAYGKVVANASYLEGCEKQIIGNSSVVVVREGEAEKGFNGKWKVISPLKVEIR